MLSRAVSVLLVPLLFVQGVCFTLCHAGPCLHQPAEHRQSPHFHWCALGWHRHEEPVDDATKGEDTHAPCTGHDEDAVYVASPLMLATRSQAPHFAVGDDATWLPVVGSPACTCLSYPPMAIAHPPPWLLHQVCPIYLRTLVLLI